MGRAVLLAVGLAIAIAAPAPAGEVQVKQVRVSSDDGQDPSYSYVEFRGAPGEANVVAVSGDRPAVLVRDATAALRTGPGCRALTAHEAECRSWRFPLAMALLSGEDGNDVLTDATALGSQLSGGVGDDVLGGDGPQYHDGGPGADRLTGSDAVDLLEGGLGPDEIRGGAGSDRIAGDPAGPHASADVLDGGPGAGDRVSYEGRTAGVIVDLARPGPHGAPGEGDVISGFEDVTGGEGADVLLGDAGPNVLDGYGGPGPRGDRLEGRAGDDRLSGTSGDDRLAGGPGEDWLSGNRGADAYAGGPGDDRLFLSLSPFEDPLGAARARIACGPGADLAADPDARTLVPRGCERIVFEYVELHLRRIGGRSLAFRLEPAHRLIPYCRVKATVTRRGRKLARRMVPVRERGGSVVFVRWRAAATPVTVRLRGTFGCRPRPGRRIGAFRLAP
jgi:Ca2+-binding RTX toxin-like protein